MDYINSRESLFKYIETENDFEKIIALMKVCYTRTHISHIQFSINWVNLKLPPINLSHPINDPFCYSFLYLYGKITSQLLNSFYHQIKDYFEGEESILIAGHITNSIKRVSDLLTKYQFGDEFINNILNFLITGLDGILFNYIINDKEINFETCIQVKILMNEFDLSFTFNYTQQLVNCLLIDKSSNWLEIKEVCPDLNTSQLLYLYQNYQPTNGESPISEETIREIKKRCIPTEDIFIDVSQCVI